MTVEDRPGDRIERAVSDLESVSTRATTAEERAAAFASSLQAALRVMAESLGECRRAIPYSTMRPVRGEDNELRWCCNHDPEHC